MLAWVRLAAIGMTPLLVGCLAQPDLVVPSGPPLRPSAGPTERLSVTRPTPTPVPGIESRTDGFEPLPGTDAIEVEPGVRRAVAERDGVRLEIVVDDAVLVGGRASWVTTRLANTGTEVLHWITDGCAINVGVTGVMGVRWAPGFEQVGPPGTFKKWLVTTGDIPAPDDTVGLRFVPKRFVAVGNFGCADLGMGHELAPGDHIVDRHRWDGTGGRFGAIPAGPAVLAATFANWWRPAHAGEWQPSVVVQLPVDVRSDRDPRALSPGQAVDAALAEPGFRAFLEANPRVAQWNRTEVELQVRRDEWIVGVRADRADAFVGINGMSGAVVWTKFGAIAG